MRLRIIEDDELQKKVVRGAKEGVERFGKEGMIESLIKTFNL
jgi:hypothetical protein